jgi:para-nitrobenzyl esterase
MNPTASKLATRRDVLKGAAISLASSAASGAAWIGVPADLHAASADDHKYPAPAPGTADTISASNDNPVVELTSGRVRGYQRKGIFTFKGIPYADTTGDSNRFLPPQKLKPWTGIRSSMQFGNVCPQPPREGWKNDETAWMFSWDDGVPGEDCLRVNLWTPGINDGRKRAVMVWLHGGGFTAGSGQELLSYDGENLARRGDVVVVTLNHRLNVFGFLNLTKFGGKYQESVNVGMLDIVASLEWVRDNIAAFGGDPNLVTIFGQSGGGGKVNALMAMPAAKGLFHRAIVESGSLLRGVPEDQSEALTDSFFKKLGLDAASIEKLQQIPFEQLEAASVAVTTRPRPASGVIDFRRVGSLLGWAPVVDGKTLPRHPFDPDAPAQSAGIPLLVGTTLNEFITAMGQPEAVSMTEDQLLSRVKSVYGDKAQAIIQAAKATYVNAIPFQLWSVIGTSSVRGGALTQAKLKAAQSAAPAYVYQFTWQTPVLNGRPMAFHCSEIAFVFDNTDRCENMTGGGKAARDLAEKVSEAWISFAKKGDPNHSGLPPWEPYSAKTGPTMIFDQQCELRSNYDQQLQEMMASA